MVAIPLVLIMDNGKTRLKRGFGPGCLSLDRGLAVEAMDLFNTRGGDR
jgi:hypothetical protein